MTIPGKHKSKTRTRKGRSHDALKLKTLSVCPKCKKTVRPHCVCQFCGTYKGKQVLKIKTKADKKKENK